MNCLNGFTVNTIEHEFGNTEMSLKKCTKCDNFVYEEGIQTCKYLLDLFDIAVEDNIE